MLRFKSYCTKQSHALQKGGEQNTPVLANTQTVKDMGIDQDLSKHMLKFEDIPAIGKQDNDQFHFYQRSEKLNNCENVCSGVTFTFNIAR